MVIKDKDLKKRSIYVYLPTVEMVRSWKKLAAKSNISLSKFVADHVENSLAKEENKKGYQTRAELILILEEKDEQIEELTKENRMLRRLSDNLDKELGRYRARPFLEEEFSGIRKYDEELVQLLKERGTIDSDHILRELRISPKRTEHVKAVYAQLENLRKFGLARPTSRGWQWHG
ncbi:hypothetical protein SCCGRSA3_00225 [Marine Group I thaumarchaeote SCGC RSA3]|uniref:Uncharacterized protein n=2 Tax=Marine Group I TaxID=905826 RepID=A0A081RQF8_9ARCH|nr:hypothetical protein AAA799N04_00123 [Marine Group I thaumarchaeote SCGC AAA799-N04]KFM20411.1 hypothetical protein SCCGRSA3_00225 [Marine Group I thaumarchaeote SCGC RSA3]